MSIYLNIEAQVARAQDLALASYVSDVRTARIVNPEWRAGQAHCNTLALLHPDVADQLPEHLDPYYDDDRLPVFLGFVRDRLPVTWPY